MTDSNSRSCYLAVTGTAIMRPHMGKPQDIIQDIYGLGVSIQVAAKKG